MPRIDVIVLFSPVEEEMIALQEEFSPIPEHHRLWDGAYYWDCELANEAARSLHIRFVQLRQQGVLHASVVTTRLARDLEPGCLISFGIAAGFLSEVNYKDVLFSTGIYYYEPAKETVEGRSTENLRGGEDESELPGRNVRLPQFVTIIPRPEIVAACHRATDRWKRDSKVRYGPLASGEKLIAATGAPSRTAIQAIQRKMLGAEMEAAGVGAAIWAYGHGESEPHIMAIKGVSDDATEFKSGTDHFRLPAAQNAAAFLRLVLEELGKDPMLLEGRRLAERQSTRTAIKMGKQLCERLQPFVGAGALDERRCARLFESGKKPKAFYHWRNRSESIHWVDIYYLRILEQMTELGIKPHLVITDQFYPHSDLTRRRIERQARAVLHDCEITWFSQFDEFRANYVDYAEAKGFDWALKKAIQQEDHILGNVDGNRLAEELLQFVVWDARESDRLIMLQWERHRKIAEVLHSLVGCEAVVVSVPTVHLDGKSAKSGDPGLALVLEPPRYEAVIQWLVTPPPVSELRDFAGYLGMHVPVPENGGSGIPLSMTADVAHLLEDSPAEVSDLVRDILRSLQFYNQRYFDDW